MYKYWYETIKFFKTTSSKSCFNCSNKNTLFVDIIDKTIITTFSIGMFIVNEFTKNLLSLEFFDKIVQTKKTISNDISKIESDNSSMESYTKVVRQKKHVKAKVNIPTIMFILFLGG